HQDRRGWLSRTFRAWQGSRALHFSEAYESQVLYSGRKADFRIWKHERGANFARSGLDTTCSRAAVSKLLVCCYGREAQIFPTVSATLMIRLAVISWSIWPLTWGRSSCRQGLSVSRLSLAFRGNSQTS